MKKYFTAQNLLFLALLVGLVSFAFAADPVAKIESKVNAAKDLSIKIGGALVVIAWIVAGTMKAFGNQRANQMLIGAAVGTFVVIGFQMMIDFFQ